MSPLVEAAAPGPGVARPAGGGSAFLRALARGLRHLAPKDGSLEAYRRWCDYEGIADPDNEWHEEMCILAGWPVAQTALAPPVGQPVPVLGIDADEALDEGAAAHDHEPDDLLEIEVDHHPAAVIHTKRTVAATAAAEQFIEWVRLADRCGTYSDKELTELTAEFFAAEGLAPIADNVFRPALLALGDDAVSKSRSDRYERLGGRRARKRQFQWTIHDTDLDTISRSVPWTDLHQNRRAA